MNRHTSQTSASTAVACFALAIGIAACAAVTRSPVPTTNPTTGQVASPASSVLPATSVHVELANASRNAVAVDVLDESGSIVGAESGAPGDGASVEPNAMIVANDDPATLRLTWAGGPCDATSTLTVDLATSRLLLVQPECSGDAIAFDRVLILHFNGPINAHALETMVQDGTDTSG